MRYKDLGFTLTALEQSAHSELDRLTERLIPRCRSQSVPVLDGAAVRSPECLFRAERRR